MPIQVSRGESANDFSSARGRPRGSLRRSKEAPAPAAEAPKRRKKKDRAPAEAKPKNPVPAYRRTLQDLKAENYVPKVSKKVYKTREEREKEDEEQALREIMAEEKAMNDAAVAAGHAAM